MITRFLLWLFWACRHRWKTVDKRELKHTSGSTGIRYILQCERCGIVRKQDLI